MEIFLSFIAGTLHGNDQSADELVGCTCGLVNHDHRSSDLGLVNTKPTAELLDARLGFQSEV